MELRKYFIISPEWGTRPIATLVGLFFQSLNRNIIFSNLLDFFCHDYRVGLLDLLGAQLLVVEVAFVLITVSVYAAEQAAATAGETWKKNCVKANVISSETKSSRSPDCIRFRTHLKV